MMRSLWKDSNEHGMILLVVLMTLPFLMLIVTYYLNLSLTSFQVARLDQLHTAAQAAADAGADYAVEQINQNSTWTGTNGEVTLHNGQNTRTTYQVSIVSSTSTTMTLAVTGRTYWPLNSAAARSAVTVYVDLRAIISGNYSIVSGEGGLYMSNSSKVVGGSVFVNGGITMQNTSQIGLSTNPINVSVADQLCPVPPDSTYPTVCGSGQGQPISISNSAIIYGTVKANNQTNGAGMASPGLTASGGVLPQALPTYDRTAQKNAVTTTYSSSAAVCPGNNGSISWPANLKIVGDVNLTNGCKVTVNGNVWITGNLTLSQSSSLTVADALGSTQPVIMVDGSGGASFQNNASLVSNASNTGFEIITFWSAATCSPDCSSVTGPDLYNSRNQPTISIQNNGNAPNTVFYAYWSQVSAGNNGSIGALIGQSINLNNNGTITFGSSTGTPTTTWVVKGYRRH